MVVIRPRDRIREGGCILLLKVEESVDPNKLKVKLQARDRLCF